MATLPQYYPDNVSINMDDTVFVRGNTVSDITGNNAIAFKVHNIKNLRAKGNKAIRIRSESNNAKGFEISNIEDAYLLYNVASRTNTGFDFYSLGKLDVFNMTAHNCNFGATVAVDGNFDNIAFSAYQDTPLYRVADGFVVDAANTITIDYVIHFGLNSLVDGTAVEGDTVNELQILYLDEPNDDLTPDYISELVNAGTENPIRDEYIDIGGIESNVTDEATAAKSYWYNLLDTVFWSTDDAQAIAVSFIKAFQSRVLANAEVTLTQVENNTHLKFAESLTIFTELYPMYARYASQTKFKKRVMDMWFSGQNAAVVQSYQNGIGGYNLLPTFFKRMEDYEDGWIIGVSFIAHDNWLNSMEDLKYGIGLDVLGTSTMNQATSGECYNNVMKSIADIAPVRWFLHDEVQPSGYVIFTDMYNSFEDCALDNMHYNDDFNISIESVGENGEAVTPLIRTDTLFASGSPSGSVEVSLLDRVYSEATTREFYYRQGVSVAAMPAWDEITDHIGGVLTVSQPYLQFKINVYNVIREIDYEFQGIGLRQYSSARDWTRPQVSSDFDFIEFMPGASLPDNGSPPVYHPGSFSLPDDGVAHSAAWNILLPAGLYTELQTIRMYFGSSASAAARVRYQIIAADSIFGIVAPVTNTVTVTTVAGSLAHLDIPLSGVFSATTYAFNLMIERDSSVAGDVLAADLDYVTGRTL